VTDTVDLEPARFISPTAIVPDAGPDAERVTVAGIRGAIVPVLERLAAQAARRDLERDLPYADVRELAARRLLWLRVPHDDGGAGASTRELYEVVIDIARADSNVAQALRSSLMVSNQTAVVADEAARARLIGRIRAGHLFSGSTNERGVPSGAVTTRVRRDGDGFVVTGTFDRTRRNPLTTGAQLYLAAVEAGIAFAALDDATRFARERARAIKHSSAQHAVDDLYVRHAVGEISARALAARAAVLLAAEALEEAWEGRGHDQAPDDVGTTRAAAVTVAEAQFIAVESALRAAELVFDVGGGGATDRNQNLDRHWRNARTVANHNPRSWKAGVIGAYRLVGEQPPANGLF
jgi:alkylation response protein AidB-like acyl-CoA dehydrogenase